jgi:hypothetical protein
LRARAILAASFSESLLVGFASAAMWCAAGSEVAHICETSNNLLVGSASAAVAKWLQTAKLGL